MNEIIIHRLVLGPIATNCYLVSRSQSGECVVIDPADQAEIIIQKVEQLNLTVKAILLTHGHYDHIGAAMELKRHYGVKIYANELEKEVLMSDYKNLSSVMGTHGFGIEADYDVKDGEVLHFAGLDIKAISTPGHTAGGMCYLMESDGKQVLFSGDTLFAGSVGRYDFPTSSGTALFHNIKEKLLVLQDDVMVYPGHGLATTIREERKNLPYR